MCSCVLCLQDQGQQIRLTDYVEKDSILCWFDGSTKDGAMTQPRSCTIPCKQFIVLFKQFGIFTGLFIPAHQSAISTSKNKKNKPSHAT